MRLPTCFILDGGRRRVLTADLRGTSGMGTPLRAFLSRLAAAHVFGERPLGPTIAGCRFG